MAENMLEIKVALMIAKPVEEVFEAIVDPAKMSNYFISSSTGRIEEHETLLWKFPEFEMEFPVTIVKVDRNKYISWNWDEPDGLELLVEIELQPHVPSSTLVTITERERENDEKGIKWLKANTEGWANFLACLKAYLEYGINLRKGGFDHLRVKPETPE